MSEIPEATAAASLAPAARGLDCCPVCRYSLHGLPIAHRCPECGFQYDEHTRAWRANSFRQYLFCLLPLTFLLIQLPQFLTWFRRGPGDWRFYFAFLFAGMIVIVAYMFITSYWRGPFVAAAPAGLYVRETRNLRVLPWNDVMDARAESAGTVCVITTGRWRVRFSSRALGGESAESMAYEIRKARDRYSVVKPLI